MIFSIVKMESTPSRTFGAPKILKFNNSNPVFQKFLLDFVIIVMEFPLFSALICGSFRLYFLISIPRLLLLLLLKIILYLRDVYYKPYGLKPRDYLIVIRRIVLLPYFRCL